ncbi:hypothetical protein OIU85_015268 [Salix viminalis]|uniref:Uncharacterized protein n=1 Tax=Salix viminalis TaxID=40686 RepID=A0A9Q0SC84_SALVM|nr:hypothetical protein OIU85_015268 [Salix viminalis]
MGTRARKGRVSKRWPTTALFPKYLGKRRGQGHNSFGKILPKPGARIPESGAGSGSKDVQIQFQSGYKSSRTDRAMKSAQPFGFKEIGGITNLCLAAGRANWSLDPEQLGGERPLSLNLAHNLSKKPTRAKIVENG